MKVIGIRKDLFFMGERIKTDIKTSVLNNVAFPQNPKSSLNYQILEDLE